MSYISIVIPTYEMNGLGREFLKHNFEVLSKQTFKDFDVVISDHSKNDDVESLCKEYEHILKISYLRNTHRIGSSSANINNAIKHAKGTLIKILFQDDFLASEYSLKQIADNFDLKTDTWLVTACKHTNNGVDFYKDYYPKYNDKIHLGKNTISSPSVLTIKNDSPLLFDEKLIWLMDCDYYKRYYIAYGEPKIINEIGIVNRVGEHQITNTLATEMIRDVERLYVKEKFRERTPAKIHLDTVTLVAVSSVKIESTVRALEYSMEGINFKEVILISHEKPERLNLNITFKQCEKITSLDAYSKFMLYDLPRYIDTEFALVAQHDGYVVRPEKWDDTFLQYDYIGAPWPLGAHFTKDGTPVLVGNGGFSLRSKKMLDSFNSLSLPFSDGGMGFFNEDGVICNYYRNDLEKHGVKFAPPEVAERFSLEDKSFPRSKKPFGFHRNKKFIPLSFHIRKFFI